MKLKDLFNTASKAVYEFIILIISMAGFVPRHATLPRTIAIGSSLVFSWFLTTRYADNSTLGIIYFIFTEILYLGFIFAVLPENGLRHWFMKKWKSEEQGYLAFEGTLGFIFFHNAAGLSFIASSSRGSLFSFLSDDLRLIIVIIMVITGFIIKIWSAKVVTIDIYYWKDMFLGRKVCEFVETGPYKFLSNPMYGIGQLQAYALAIWFGSAAGLIAAALNQLLIFIFYFTAEKRFIRRVYLKE